MQERNHTAKMATVSLEKSRLGLHWFVMFSNFTFKQGKSTKNQSFPVHPIHIYDKLKLNVIYSRHSGDGIHSFLRNQRFFRDYLP